MSNYEAPGVYANIRSSGNKPIESVGASTAAFIGQSSKGEVNKPMLITSFDKCDQLADVIRIAGAQIGIDQCGRQLGSMDYLQKLQPNYIKLDQSFAYYEKTNQNKELCRALLNVAKGLNIDVIITGIEDEEQLAHFNLLKADGYQGYISPIEDV